MAGWKLDAQLLLTVLLVMHLHALQTIQAEAAAVLCCALQVAVLCSVVAVLCCALYGAVLCRVWRTCMLPT